jgi:hypothetical protein
MIRTCKKTAGSSADLDSRMLPELYDESAMRMNAKTDPESARGELQKSGLGLIKHPPRTHD